MPFLLHTSGFSVAGVPLIDLNSSSTAAVSGGAILQNIQIRCAALLDLNGHSCLILNNVLALHSDDLGVPEH